MPEAREVGAHTKPIKIGTYRFGFRTIALQLDPAHRGGSFDMNLEPDGRSVLTVGIKDDWPAVVATFLHEAMEAALVGIHCRYDAFPSFSLSSARFRFFHTHEQFAEAVQQAGEFLAKALPDVSAAYRKHRKNHGQA